MDYSRFLNGTGRITSKNVLRDIADKLAVAPADKYSLANGLPSPCYFPIESCTVVLKDGSSFRIEGELMESCLQYGSSKGYGPPLKQVSDLTYRHHQPPLWSNRTVMVTNGAQHGLSILVSVLMEDGDYFVTTETTYPGIMDAVRPCSPKILAVKSDSEGIRTDHLRQVLLKWKPEDARKAHHGVPKLMYVNPYGNNPNGGTMSMSRMQELYSIAREYNLLIFEDDPYYYSAYVQNGGKLPSLLSMDTDGRVLRCDSFSKLLGPGLRIGFLTLPKPLQSSLFLQIIRSCLHLPTITQVMVSKLLELWDAPGLNRHLDFIRQNLKGRRDLCLKAVNTYLTGLCEWNVPTAGMFLWVKVLGLDDSRQLVNDCMAQNVFLVPGSAFATNPHQPSPYIRLAYCFASPDIIEEGIKRLSQLIRKRTNTPASTQHIELKISNGNGF